MNFGFLKFGSLLLLGAPAPGRPHMSFQVSPCYKKIKIIILIGVLNHFFHDFYEHNPEKLTNQNVWYLIGW